MLSFFFSKQPAGNDAPLTMVPRGVLCTRMLEMMTPWSPTTVFAGGCFRLYFSSAWMLPLLAAVSVLLRWGRVYWFYGRILRWSPDCTISCPVVLSWPRSFPTRRGTPDRRSVRMHVSKPLGCASSRTDITVGTGEFGCEGSSLWTDHDLDHLETCTV